MLKLEFEQVQASYKELGYHFFLKGQYNLNIFGVRTATSMSNKFDDVLGVAYIDANKQERLELFPITTDPGKYYLKNPLNKKGTLILVPGYYKGVYTKGLHGRSSKFGPYEALEQIKPMTYVRDNNKDDVLNFELYRNPELFKENRIDGIFKTNIHRASKWKILAAVERYSAGCQVFQSPEDFKRFMSLIDTSIREGWPNTFTYTLFEQFDILELNQTA